MKISVMPQYNQHLCESRKTLVSDMDDSPIPDTRELQTYWVLPCFLGRFVESCDPPSHHQHYHTQMSVKENNGRSYKRPKTGINLCLNNSRVAAAVDENFPC